MIRLLFVFIKRNIKTIIKFEPKVPMLISELDLNNKKVLDISTCIKSDDLIAGRMLLISMGKKNKFLLQVKS